MARDPISPELALVDPTLALRDTKEAWPIMDSLDPTSISPASTNGTAAGAPVQTAPSPSVEALLFNAGAISADQLGELVRDAVLTQRPVAAIAVERGLATLEMLAALQTNVGIDIPVPRPPEEPNASPHLEASAPEVVSSPMPPPAEPEPVELVVSQLDGTTGFTTESELATSPQPEPLRSLDERVQAAVARATQAPLRPPAPVAAATPEPQTVVVADGLPAGATAVFTVLVRLQSGERLAAGAAATFESATEDSRSLAAQLARADEWPFIAGRCIRPDTVVSVDIEHALEG